MPRWFILCTLGRVVYFESSRFLKHCNFFMGDSIFVTDFHRLDCFYLLGTKPVCCCLLLKILYKNKNIVCKRKKTEKTHIFINSFSDKKKHFFSLRFFITFSKKTLTWDFSPRKTKILNLWTLTLLFLATEICFWVGIPESSCNSGQLLFQ